MTVPTTLARSLANPRFEIIPMEGVEDQIAYLPEGAKVTITSSPSKGIEPTLELAEQLAGRGFGVVPHVAARLVASQGHLGEILARLRELRIGELFVVAGDAAEPLGPYDGAHALLQAMAELGHGLDDVGITGYPESHAVISDQTTISAMFAKEPYATYIVSQICYDPAVTSTWIHAVRRRGVRLPIYLGIPGVVDRKRLARISLRVGLGDSMRFLRKQGNVVAKLFGGYTPDELVEGLGQYVLDGACGVSGWHLFTFNEIRKTEQWRRKMLADVKGAQT